MNQTWIKTLAISAVFVLVACKKNDVDVTKNEEITTEIATATENPDSKLTQEQLVEKYGLTEVKFDKTEFDFGKITQGDKPETTFTVTNVGKYDLVITDAHGSCGCTVPEVSKKPIAPGDSTVIKVKFDSTGKQGLTEKTVFVKCNTKAIIQNLIIKADIQTK